MAKQRRPNFQYFAKYCHHFIYLKQKTKVKNQKWYFILNSTGFRWTIKIVYPIYKYWFWLFSISISTNLSMLNRKASFLLAHYETWCLSLFPFPFRLSSRPLYSYSAKRFFANLHVKQYKERLGPSLSHKIIIRLRHDTM